jgi:NADH-quinone oxidoreductase subunit E
MAVRRLSLQQPESFAFSAENVTWVDGQIAKYPEGRQASAVIPLLWKAQEQAGGWLPEPAIRHVADVLGMPYIRVMEVATFYTMFNLAPVGEFFVQLCGTTPCALRGANALKDVCKKVIGPEKTVSSDGKLSWMEVECLGACSNAPMIQLNHDYIEDLTPESLEQLLGDLRAGKEIKTGSQTGRASSCPQGGATTLTDASLYDGSLVGAWRKRFETVSQPEQAPTEAAKPKTPGSGEKMAADSPADKKARGASVKPAAKKGSPAPEAENADPAPKPKKPRAPRKPKATEE